MRWGRGSKLTRGGAAAAPRSEPVGISTSHVSGAQGPVRGKAPALAAGVASLPLRAGGGAGIYRRASGSYLRGKGGGERDCRAAAPSRQQLRPVIDPRLGVAVIDLGGSSRKGRPT